MIPKWRLNLYLEEQCRSRLIAENKEAMQTKKSDEWDEEDEIPLIELKRRLEAGTNKIEEELPWK